LNAAKAVIGFGAVEYGLLTLDMLPRGWSDWKRVRVKHEVR
jgi:hypothetical protein